MKKLITILLLTSSFLYSQTASLSVSGKVENLSGNGQISHITVNQLVGNQFEERGQTETDSLGFFNLALNNITSIKEESSTNSVVNFILNNNSLYSPINTKAEIIYYTILGETVSRELIELSLGNNELKPINNSLSSGIYIRRIELSQGVITQKIVKNASQLSYGISGNLVLDGISNGVQLNKITSDSLYLMTVATCNGYLPDTIFTTVSKDNPEDVTGLNLVLRVDYSNTIHTAYLTVATLKDVYFENEQINLTDPPDVIKSKVVENFNAEVLSEKPDEIKSSEQIDSAKSNEINKLIASSQNKFELRLSIPSHFPEYLQKPQRFFSGRTFKIVYADGSEFKEYPKKILLSKREENSNLLISDNIIEVNKLRSTYFAFAIPEETKSGFYTIEFEIGNENFMLPVQIVGLTKSEIDEINSVPKASILDERVVLNKQLNCGYCYWESVFKINPAKSDDASEK